MGPAGHAVIAGAVGVGLLAGGAGTAAAGTAVAVGILIDADHLVDYVRTEGFRIDLAAVRSGSYFGKAGKALVLLHSYELVILAATACAALGRPDLALGVAAGALTHLAADVAYYGFTPWCYSTSYRARHGFRLTSFKRRPRPVSRKDRPSPV